jgi:hypothetical protein
LFVVDAPIWDGNSTFVYSQTGQDMRLDCMVCSNPKPNFSDVIWTKDSTYMSGKQEIEEINSLMIKNIKASQFGNYTCSIGYPKIDPNRYNFTIVVEQGNLFSHYICSPFHF